MDMIKYAVIMSFVFVWGCYRTGGAPSELCDIRDQILSDVETSGVDFAPDHLVNILAFHRPSAIDPPKKIYVSVCDV